MAHNTDWLPGRRADQIAMAKKWYTVLNRAGTAWGVPPNVKSDLAGFYQDAEDMLNEALSSARTAVITARCKEYFDKLIAKMRDIKKRYFLTPPLADSDYVELGLKPPDKNPTPVPAPTAQVEADLTFPGIHMVELKRIRAVGGPPPDDGSGYGVRAFWGFTGPATEKYPFRLTGAPKSGKELPYSQSTRRSKELFDFDGESGNTVYFCLRYENPTGGEGPFGPMLKAVIP